MLCNEPTWIVYAVQAVLSVCGILVVVLMQKAWHDQQINRVDSEGIRKARRWGFIAIAGSVVAVLLSDISMFALLLLFLSTATLLVIDIKGLDQRPPNDGHREAFAGQTALAPLRHLIGIFRRH